MANSATIELKAQNNQALQAFRQLDDQEKKLAEGFVQATNESKKLDLALKQTELQLARVNAKAEQVQRTMSRASRGGGVYELAPVGPATQSAVPRAEGAYGIARTEAEVSDIHSRWAASRGRARSVVATGQYFANQSFAREFADQSLAAGREAQTPYMLGTAAIGAAGIQRQGEDRLMTRARMAVRANLARMPELMGRVTEEEFETMSRNMRAEMEKRMSRGVGVGGMAMAAAVAGMAMKATTSLVSDDLYTREQQAAGRMLGYAPARRELRQIAPDGRTFHMLMKAMDVTRAAGGFSEQESGKIVFAAQSAGFDLMKIPQFASNMKRLALDPTTALQAAQKIRDNYGEGAGDLNQIIDKLLIAAGPSPANVNELAAGVGGSAAAFRAIGGTADEQMAALGVLSTRLKNPEAAAEYLKSVSNQLQKKAGRIKWGVNEKPLAGVDLIAALPRLERNNMLLDEQGRPTSADTFLGEMLASNAADQIGQAEALIRATTGKMRAAARDPGSVARSRGTLFDLKADTAGYMGKMQNQRAQKEEQQLGPLFALAEGVAERELKDATGDGQRTQLVGLLEKFKTANRSLWTGSSQESFLIDRLYSGSLTNEEQQLYFGSRLQNMPLGMLEGLLQGKANWHVGAAGAIGSDPLKTSATFTGRTPGMMGMVGATVEKEKARKMDPGMAANYEYAIQQRIRLLKEQEAGSRPGIVDRVNGFMSQIGSSVPSSISNAMAPISNFVAQSGAVAGSFNAIVPAYMQSTGLSREDYRVQTLQKMVDERRNQAVELMVATGMKTGGNIDAIRPDILRSAAEIPGKQLQSVYTQNMDFIDRSLADAEAAGTDAAGTQATRDYGAARAKAIKEMKLQATRSGGRIDAVEAQAIRDQVSGRDPMAETQQALLKAVEGIGQTLGKIVEKLPQNDGKGRNPPPPLNQTQTPSTTAN